MTSPLNPLISNCITLLQIELSDKLNPAKKIYGTAFWVKSRDGKVVLVTNKHNLDPSLKNKELANHRILKIEVQLREKNEKGYVSEREFFEIDLSQLNGKAHPASDVAILIQPGFKTKRKAELELYQDYFPYDELANQAFFIEKMAMLDPVAFIGFPQTWYDTARKSPIARVAYLANNPMEPFSNPEIRTEDVLLVSGLSFGGSSGSPVILLPKGLDLRGGRGITVESSYIPGKLIGIMSGHCRDILLDPRIPSEDDRFSSAPKTLLAPYSGLSYFTRSTSILDLLETEIGVPITDYLCETDVVEV
jgi:hypothetical protein